MVEQRSPKPLMRVRFLLLLPIRALVWYSKMCQTFFIFTWVQFLPFVRTHELRYITKPFNYNRKVGDNIGNKIGDNPITRKAWIELNKRKNYFRNKT